MNNELLAMVLDELIPPSADGRMPGAGTLGIEPLVEHAAATTPDLGPLLAQGFAALEDLARRRDPTGFAGLERSMRVEVLRELEQSVPMFLPTLLTLACVGYYSSEPVLIALNGNARPPHPVGYELEPDDLSLLASVRARPTLYRKC